MDDILSGHDKDMDIRGIIWASYYVVIINSFRFQFTKASPGHFFCTNINMP